MNHTERSALEDHYRFHCHPPLLHNLYEQRLGLYLSLSQEKEESPSLNRKKKKEKKNNKKIKFPRSFPSYIIRYNFDRSSILLFHEPLTISTRRETSVSTNETADSGKRKLKSVNVENGWGKRKKKKRKKERGRKRHGVCFNRTFLRLLLSISSLPSPLPSFFSVRAETKRSNKSCNNRGSCPSYTLLLSSKLALSLRQWTESTARNTPAIARETNALIRRDEPPRVDLWSGEKKYRRSFNLLTHAHVLSRCSVVRPCECEEEEEDSSHESVLSKVYMRWDVETRCSYYWKIICTDWVDWQSWCIYVCGDLRNLYNRWDNNTGYRRREWVILVKIHSLLFPISLFVILKRYSYCKF